MNVKDKFLNTLSVQNYSPLTVKNYRRYLESFGVFFGKPLEHATSDDITAYMSSRNKDSPNTRVAVYIALQSFYSFLLEDGIISKRVRVPTVKAERTVVKVMAIESIRRMISSIELKRIQDYRDRALIEFLYVTGVRVSEAMRMRIDDASSYKLMKSSRERDRHLKVRVRGKGHKEREIYVNSRSADVLFDYLLQRNDKNPLMFIAHCGNGKGGLSANRIRTILIRRAADARVSKHVHPHLLRHSIATHMLEAGVNVFTLQKFLGHESLESTRKYIQFLDHDYRKVCEGTIRQILYR